ncbi:F-box protein [Tanacetum coccineum]
MDEDGWKIKDGLSPMRAGTPDGGVQAQFAERAEYFSEMAVEGLGLELEMLEGTLKTIEDTMARMDKEEQLQGNFRVGYKARRICKEKGAALLKNTRNGGWMSLGGILLCITVNVKKEMDLFFKGAARGSTLAMVDVGLVYWQIGKKDEGVRMYKRAAELGDPAGQCNLGISYLQGRAGLELDKAQAWLV